MAEEPSRGPAFGTRLASARKAEAESDSGDARFLGMSPLRESIAEIEQSLQNPVSADAYAKTPETGERSEGGMDSLSADESYEEASDQFSPTGDARFQSGPVSADSDLATAGIISGSASDDPITASAIATASAGRSAAEAGAVAGELARSDVRRVEETPSPSLVSRVASLIGLRSGAEKPAPSGEEKPLGQTGVGLAGTAELPENPISVKTHSLSGLLRFLDGWTTPDGQPTVNKAGGLPSSQPDPNAVQQPLEIADVARERIRQMVADGKVPRERAEVMMRELQLAPAEPSSMPASGLLPNKPDIAPDAQQSPRREFTNPARAPKEVDDTQLSVAPKPCYTSTVLRPAAPADPLLVDPDDQTGYIWDDSPFIRNRDVRPKTRPLDKRAGVPPLVTENFQLVKQPQLRRVSVPPMNAPEEQYRLRLKTEDEVVSLGQQVASLKERVTALEESNDRAHAGLATLREDMREESHRQRLALDMAETRILQTQTEAVNTLARGQAQLFTRMDEVLRVVRQRSLEYENEALERSAVAGAALPEPRVGESGVVAEQLPSLQLDESAGGVKTKRVPPRYSQLYPPSKVQGASLEPVAEETRSVVSVVSVEPETEPVLPEPSMPANDPVTISLSGPASLQASGQASLPASVSHRRKPGVPMVGNKLVQEVVGKFSDETGNSTLRQFIDRVNQLVDDMEWDDATAGRAAKSCLLGRAFDCVHELRGQEGAYTWTNIQRVLRQEFYSQAACTSSEVKLDSVKREAGESVRKFGLRVERLVNTAFNAHPKHTRDTEACRTFLRGVDHRNMVIRLREKHESLAGLTLRRLIGEAETYLSLREGKDDPSSGTVAAVQASDGKKGGKKDDKEKESKPSNSNQAGKKQQGKGKKKGPKPVAKTKSDDGSGKSLQDQLNELKKQVTARSTTPQEPCRGNCWKCGRPGHRKAECPKGICRVVKGKKEHPCPDHAGHPCACPCSEHEHFGYGIKESSDD